MDTVNQVQTQEAPASADSPVDRQPLINFLEHWLAIAKGHKPMEQDPLDLRLGFAFVAAEPPVLTALAPTEAFEPALKKMADLASEAMLFHMQSLQAMVPSVLPLVAQRSSIGRPAELIASEVEAIAEACHEMNRLWCTVIKDHATPPWNWAEAPDWQKTSCLDGVRFHLANPDAPDSASHENWLKHKAEDGWVYGPFKDAQAKTHPCIVPFDQLPVEQQAKDAIFARTVKVLAKALRG